MKNLGGEWFLNIENLQTIETISLDFYNNNIITINVKQLDTDSRGVRVYCTEHGKKFVLNTFTHSVFVRYKKPDGNDVFNDCYIQDDGSVLFELTQQMTAVAGRSKLDILIFCASGLTVEDIGDITNFNDLGISTLSTMILGLNIHPNATDLKKIESSYEYDALIDGLARHVAIEKHMEELDATLTTNEEQRQSDEIIRQNRETERVTSETNRVQAELLRITQMNEIIENSNQAVINANNAASDANNAAIDATNAGDKCEKIVEKYENLDFDKIDEILDYKVEITQAEYNALSDVEKNNGKIYFITDVNEGGTASEVFYNNANSNLISTNVQGVLDEINERKLAKNYVVNNLTTTEEGYALDARQGKILENRISQLTHIGMVIHSTTLDTMEKVIAIYGGIRWEKIEGRFLLGANSSYPVNTTGGEATHTLTIAEMPLHSHGFLDYWGTSYDSSLNQGARNCVALNGDGSGLSGGYPNANTKTADTGGNQPHNNMPPYKAVYIWERTQ